MAQVLLTQEHVPVAIEIYLLAIDNINTIRKNVGTLIDASKKAGIEVKKAKYILLRHDQNAGESHSVLRYLGIMVTNQNTVTLKLRAD
jgi:hypothetical protein